MFAKTATIAAQRTVWVLREIDDASFVDIGHTLGSAASTVRGHHRHE